MFSNRLISELSLPRQEKDKEIIKTIVDDALTNKEKEMFAKSEGLETKDVKTYTSLAYFLLNFQDIYLGNKLNFYAFSSVQLVTFFVALCGQSLVSTVAFLVFLTIILRNMACVLFANPIVESYNNRVRFDIIRELIDTRKQL